MNFQGNRQREGLFSAQCDAGKNKGVRHPFMPQKANTTTNAVKTAIDSSRFKHAQFDRLEETGKERAFPTRDDGKRKQSFATRLPLSKSSEKSTQRKFQGVNVYGSFIEEVATEDSERRKNGAASQGKVASHSTERTNEACSDKPSHGTPPNHAIRRYALYRRMICHSRFEEDHNLWKVKNKHKVSCSRDKSEETITRTTTIQADQNNKHEPTQSRACDANTVDDQTPEMINCSPRNDNSTGSQFPKRIYIREMSNGAIVDEIVDVQNERDWEVLNYMTPLRHITSKPHERSDNLRFRDLRDFDVYYYPHPWR